VIAALLVVCGMAYSLLAILAILRFQPNDQPSRNFAPPISILKPVRGRDERFFEAIRSHAVLDYPQYEILFGISVPEDPALEDIARLQREFPHIAIRVVDTANHAPNGKAGTLEILAHKALHEVLVVNDSDILVEPDYLFRVVSPLEPEGKGGKDVGLVTCLYRAQASSWPARAEALGIVTEFAPSVLVAHLLSDSAFAFGSTMAFRRASLDAIGGFAAVQDYLADDYQLGLRISALEKRVVLAGAVVETSLGAGSLSSVWKHQVRWSRTIRVSRPLGYLGYLITQISFWSLIALLAGYPLFAVAGFGIRLLAAGFALYKLDRSKLPALPLVPLRDVFGIAVWLAGLVGSEVEWRGIRFRLHRNGTISPVR
jgi:ceramide glucosyltransferase